MQDQIIGTFKYTRVVLIAILCAFLFGCTVPLTCYIYNNSGEPIKISKYGSGKITTEYHAKQGEQVVVDEWEYGKYVIEIGQSSYKIDPQDIYILTPAKL